jgi:hypothetical protein
LSDIKFYLNFITQANIIATINEAHLGYAYVYFADEDDHGRGPKIAVKIHKNKICDDSLEELKECEKWNDVYRSSGQSFHHIILLVRGKGVKCDEFHKEPTQEPYLPIPWKEDLDHNDEDIAHVLSGSRRIEYTRYLADEIMNNTKLTSDEKEAKVEEIAYWCCVVYNLGEKFLHV